MPTLVARIALTGTKEEISPARRAVVDEIRAWGVTLDDETAEVIRLIASELITNALVYGEGPVSIGLYHRPGSLVMDVLDGNPCPPLMRCAGAEDESGRGLALVEFFAAKSGWEPVERGKRVWAEIPLPLQTPVAPAAVDLADIEPGTSPRTRSATPAVSASARMAIQRSRFVSSRKPRRFSGGWAQADQRAEW